MTHINRRAMIAATSAALILPHRLMAQAASEPFSWDRLIARAHRLARAPFAETPLYPGAQAIDYDALHQARFAEDRTIWGDLPGDTGVRLFPLSRTAAQPVQIALVDKGRATPLRYDPAMFDAPDSNPVKKLPPDAGFAGFRIMNAARDGDWLSFLGASYFRAPSPQKQFGLSARAIAINTSLQGKEEFPRFTHFWLERTGDSSVTIHALLDGASITGAFRFVSSLGKDGVRQDVTAALFPRRAIPELGLMPMTSMFWYDQANRRQGTDWRPEIHDSDMLSIASGDGSVHARPLVNPAMPQISAFAERDPKGFGLLQRDRDFAHYQDDGVFYDRRPRFGRALPGRLARDRCGSTVFRRTANIPIMSRPIGRPMRRRCQGGGLTWPTGWTGRLRKILPEPRWQESPMSGAGVVTSPTRSDWWSILPMRRMACGRMCGRT